MAPAMTQKLRDLIELATIGAVSIEELHNELLGLEQLLSLPLTHPAGSEVPA